MRTRGVVSEYDVARFHPLANHTITRLLCGESARIATLSELVNQRFAYYDKELKSREAALEEAQRELARCQEQLKEATDGQIKWRDRYNREVASGQGFLKSEAGKIYLDCIWGDFKKKYEKSEEFESAVITKANDIYDQTIRHCRSVLRSCGRFEGEDFLFLDPKVQDEDEADEGELEIAYEPPTTGAPVDMETEGGAPPAS